MNMPPLDAIPGFSLSTGMRYVAAYYGVRIRMLKRRDARNPQVGEARDALCYLMTVKHGWTPARLAQQLGCTARAVRDGADRHIAAIALFRETHGVKAEPAEGASA